MLLPQVQAVPCLRSGDPPTRVGPAPPLSLQHGGQEIPHSDACRPEMHRFLLTSLESSHNVVTDLKSNLVQIQLPPSSFYSALYLRFNLVYLKSCLHCRKVTQKLPKADWNIYTVFEAPTCAFISKICSSLGVSCKASSHLWRASQNLVTQYISDTKYPLNGHIGLFILC